MPVYKVLVADASTPFQDWISQVLTPASGVTLAGRVLDGAAVEHALKQNAPEVLMLDMFLPPHDGISLLDRIMRQTPLPVVLFSSLHCPSDSELFLECCERGAQAVLPKPRSLAELQALGPSLQALIALLAGRSREKLVIEYLEARRHVLERVRAWPARKAVGIISSTGAVEMLRDVLLRLPAKLPIGVLVAQHMYAPVWRNFAASLASRIPHPVKLAQGGEIVREGHILLSPTDKTMLFKKAQCGRVAHLEAARIFEKLEVPLQPNHDEFFMSIAESFGRNAVGIVLSGMGEGGVRGARAIRDRGGEVWIQDPSTASAPSMPEAVLKAGLATRVCSPEKLSSELTRFCAAADTGDA